MKSEHYPSIVKWKQTYHKPGEYPQSNFRCLLVIVTTPILYLSPWLPKTCNCDMETSYAIEQWHTELPYRKYEQLPMIPAPKDRKNSHKKPSHEPYSRQTEVKSAIFNAFEGPKWSPSECEACDGVVRQHMGCESQTAVRQTIAGNFCGQVCALVWNKRDVIDRYVRLQKESSVIKLGAAQYSPSSRNI